MFVEKPVYHEPEIIAGKYVYSDFEVNVPINDQTFSIDWKKGTEVLDYEAKKFYTVGDTSENEAKQMKSFMIYQGLDSPPEIPRNDNTFRNMLFGVAIVIIVLSIVYFFSRRRVK
jgi:ATP-dependent Zn protease